MAIIRGDHATFMGSSELIESLRSNGLNNRDIIQLEFRATSGVMINGHFHELVDGKKENCYSSLIQKHFQG